MIGRLIDWLIEFFQDNNKDPLDQENIELLAMSSTSKGINNPAAVSLSTNTLDENGDETDSFTNQQLFSFAWQIAKGMVITDQFWSEVFPKREGNIICFY